MQVEHVISILESLANGVDPTTDTEIPHQLFGSPDIIRALFTAATILQRLPVVADGERPETVLRLAKPSATGARWTQEEDERVCREYDDGVSFMDIAQRHARTTGAIMSRLVKLGRVDPDTLAPRLRAQTLAAVQ